MSRLNLFEVLLFHIFSSQTQTIFWGMRENITACAIFSAYITLYNHCTSIPRSDPQRVMTSSIGELAFAARSPRWSGFWTRSGDRVWNVFRSERGTCGERLVRRAGSKTWYTESKTHWWIWWYSGLYWTHGCQMESCEDTWTLGFFPETSKSKT